MGALVGASAGLLFLAFYWPRITWMWDLWVTNGVYSYGLLVPLTSGGILYLKRGELRKTPRSQSRAGLLLVAASVFLTILLDWSGLHLNSLTPLLMIASTSGIVLAVWGLPWLRSLAFPIGFLIFLVPLPPPVLSTLDFPLQVLCARVSVIMAHAVGITAQRLGAMVYLPNFSMTIAPACNGLRSSVAMLALAVVFAYLVNGPLSRKVLLVALAIPLAYLANFARLFSDVLVTNTQGARFEPYERTYDLVWGFLTFLLAVALFLILARLLKCNEFHARS